LGRGSANAQSSRKVIEMAKSTEVAEAKTTDVAVMDIEMFEQDANQGLDNIGQEDLALPFLKVLSGNDPVLDENEEARKGDIYNTVTGKIYKGKEGIRVIPCYYSKRFIQWAPRGTGNGAPINIFEPDDVRPETQRSSEDNKEYVVGGNGDYIEAVAQHFVVVINDDGSTETALISMKSTQLKKSRKWNSMMASLTINGKNGPFTPPPWSHIYVAKTVQEENSKGSWHGWEITREGPVTDKALYLRSKTFAESIRSGDVKVKHEDDNHEGGSPF